MKALSAPEQQRVPVEWNQTNAPFPERCLHEQFEEQVQRTPDAVAVVFEDTQLTYRQLDQRANQLAHHLRALGVRPDVRVGICVERSLEMVVALLGVLKAGGAYVPIDPSYPKDRVEFMLEDSAATVLLSMRALVTGGVAVHAATLCLDDDWAAIARESDVRLAPTGTPQQLAYVIYTSGSTGRPKGVMIDHRAVSNLLAAMGKELGMNGTDVLAAVTSLSFDIAGLEIYLPLLCGATLVVVARQEAGDGKRLRARLTGCKATLLQATPSTFRLLLDAEWPRELALRTLCGGEALPESLAIALAQNATEAWNVYGPTETTIWSTSYRLEAGDRGTPPIGRPIDNTTVRVLDEQMTPVAIGTPGELYIGGAGLARGYHGRPGLTAERFVPDPFEPAGGRLYKTGDLVMWRSDGTLAYLGRLDHQVKVRGFRIELGEVETALARCTGVKVAVVVAREDQPGDKRLVAYLVGATDVRPTVTELRSRLGETLPDYMVPAAFMWLDAMPLTPNGKIDRGSLPAPVAGGERGDRYRAPQTPSEGVLAGIWAQLLKVDRVGLDDNFFHLGGHSLLAMQLITQVRALLEVELPLGTLFKAPTLAALARAVDDLVSALDASTAHRAPSALRRVEGTEPRPASLIQEWFWTMNGADGANAFSTSFAYHVEGELDLQRLETCVVEIVRRHEILRTRYREQDGQLLQIVGSDSPQMVVVDLHDLLAGDRLAEATRRTQVETVRPFFLARESPLRCTVYRVSNAEHLVAFNIHHIASDAWSVGVFAEELSALYAAPDRALPPPAIQYGDFAVWQHAAFDARARTAHNAFWREYLAGSTRAELPTDRPRPPLPRNSAASLLYRSLPADLVDALGSWSRSHDATLFLTLLAAFKGWLRRRTGARDIVVATTTGNRTRVETNESIGCFFNPLVIRTDVGENMSFVDLVARVRERALAAFEYQDVPIMLEGSAGEWMTRFSALAPTMFQLQTEPGSGWVVPGARVKRIDLHDARTGRDLFVELAETATGELDALLKFNAELFDSSTIASWWDEYVDVLRAVTRA